MPPINPRIPPAAFWRQESIAIKFNKNKKLQKRNIFDKTYERQNKETNLNVVFSESTIAGLWLNNALNAK